MVGISAIKPCPICGKIPLTGNEKFLPFCSNRCSVIDLGRWLGEDYRIPSEDNDDEAEEAPDTGGDA